MRAENIKFRGKSKRTGEWLYGDLEYNRKKDIARIHSYDDEGEYIGQQEVDKETIGQLIAKIRKPKGDICEVYSQDIVKLTAYDGEIQYVIVDNRGFVESKFLEFRTLIHFVDDFDVEWEVVGNIYDNKELLQKGGKQWNTTK